MGDWWRGAVMYQIYPRSFQDSNGDGIGDLEGITRRLPYVADLGVDAVWLSPIFTSPMLDMGYDVSDYTNIDPIFGSLADFDSLVAAARVPDRIRKLVAYEPGWPSLIPREFLARLENLAAAGKSGNGIVIHEYRFA